MAGTLGEKFSEIDRRNGWMLLFTALRQQSAQTLPPFEDAKLPANARMNRYRDVLPFDHSRVRLGEQGYINANFVPVPEAERSYILTQGPLSHTSEDFWQMVWEQKATAVVMLNRIMEKGQNKCHLYFPTADENNGYSSKLQKYGNFEVELQNERKTRHYIIRGLQLSNVETGDRRDITHFQFITWPDFGVPESTSDFLEFLLEVRRSHLLNYRRHGPAVIHCSAGVGRSGTFVIADAALVIAHKTKDPSQIDIVQMVLDMRQFRMGLIQTHEQLRFSWKAVVDALEQKRWKELVELACCNDQEQETEKLSDAASDIKRPPSKKRLSGNRLTDANSDTEPEEITDEEISPAVSATVTLLSLSKEVEKSPKRRRPDPNHPNSNADGFTALRDPPTEAEPEPEKNEEKRASEPEQGSSAAGGDAQSTTDSSTERYQARLRRRQERALEFQKKIDKIQENLRRPNSADVWNNYTSWLYGVGVGCVVGGLLIYLFCKWF